MAISRERLLECISEVPLAIGRITDSSHDQTRALNQFLLANAARGGRTTPQSVDELSSQLESQIPINQEAIATLNECVPIITEGFPSLRGEVTTVALITINSLKGIATTMSEVEVAFSEMQTKLSQLARNEVQLQQPCRRLIGHLEALKTIYRPNWDLPKIRLQANFPPDSTPHFTRRFRANRQGANRLH